MATIKQKLADWKRQAKLKYGANWKRSDLTEYERDKLDALSTRRKNPGARSTLRDKAAAAIDATLDDAASKRGIYTDKVRDTLAAYLDGAVKLRASTVRKYIHYLQMIARKKNPGARFTQSQLARIRSAYAKLDRVDPSQSGYNKLAPYLSSLSQDQLKQLAGAKVKFLSKLAANRLSA